MEAVGLNSMNLPISNQEVALCCWFIFFLTQKILEFWTNITPSSLL
jgi:hypothetical protein